MTHPPHSFFGRGQVPRVALWWNPDLVLTHPQVYSKPLPRALLNALAPFWRGVPTTQPKKIVKDTLKLLEQAASKPHPGYGFQTLHPSLLQFFCQQFDARVVGQCVFTLPSGKLTPVRSPMLSPSGLDLSQWAFPSPKGPRGTANFIAAISTGYSADSDTTFEWILRHVNEVIGQGASVLLAIEDFSDVGPAQLCNRCSVPESIAMQLLSTPPHSLPLGTSCGFADDKRKHSGERTNTWRIKAGKLCVPSGFNAERLLRHPDLLSRHSIQFIYIRPRLTEPLLWHAESVQKLAGILTSVSYFPSHSNTSPPSSVLHVRVPSNDRAALGLNPATNDDVCNDISLHPDIILDDTWRRQPLYFYIPDLAHSDHFPLNPLKPEERLTPESMISGVVLATDTAILKSFCLSKSMVESIAAAVGYGLVVFDYKQERIWIEDQNNLRAELGTELRLKPFAPFSSDVLPTSAPVPKTCALCDVSADKFFILRPSDGPAAVTLIHWAAEKWAIKVLAAPKKCKCKHQSAHTQQCKDEKAYRNKRLVPSFESVVAPGGVQFCYECFAGITPAAKDDSFQLMASPLAELTHQRWSNFFENCDTKQRAVKTEEILTRKRSLPAEKPVQNDGCVTRSHSLPPSIQGGFSDTDRFHVFAVSRVSNI